MKPNPGETYIVGKWLFDGNKMTADANCKRIEELTTSYFLKVKSSPDGWSVIFQDPLDLRYWELSYPQSEMQGGGPPMLSLVDDSVVNQPEYNPFKKLSKSELILVVQKLLDVEGTYDEEQEQWKVLQANFPNWRSVLTDIHYVVGDLHTMTAEEIVDKGLAYKPIQLPEKFDGE